MKSGVWHQCGHQSHNIVVDQLQNGNGVGVILSPLDASLKKTTERSSEYRDTGADVLLDLQLYNPSFSLDKLSEYGLDDVRQSVTTLGELSPALLSDLAKQVETLNRDMRTTAVLAPAVIYQPERLDIVAVNEQFFNAAKAAGDAIGVPTYASVILGEGFQNAPELAEAALSRATSLRANGWYFAVENNGEAIPNNEALVQLNCDSHLSLACSGLPVFSAFAGPTSLIAIASGATAVGLGHWKNLWRFTSSRFMNSESSNSRMPAPRYFSQALWSTIVLPDEAGNLDSNQWKRIVTTTPYEPRSALDGNWSLRSSHNHLLFAIGSSVAARLRQSVVRKVCDNAIADLLNAAAIHADLQRSLGVLRDGANAHQHIWAGSLTSLVSRRSNDFDLIQLFR